MWRRNIHFSNMKNTRLRTIIFVGFTVLSTLPVFLLGMWVKHTTLENEIHAVQDKHLLVARNLTNALARYSTDVITVFNFATSFKPEQLHNIDLYDILSSMHFSYVGFFNQHFEETYRLFSIQSDTKFTLPNSIKKQLANIKVEKTLLFPLTPNFYDEPLILSGKKLSDGGYVIGALQTTYIEELQQAITFGKLGHAAIVDSEGRVIAHPKKEWQKSMKDLSEVAPVEMMKSKQTGVAQFYSPAVKADMIAGFSVVPEIGWGAMIPQPMSELEQRADSFGILMWYVGGSGLLFATVLSWWLSGLLAAPLRSVAEAAKAISRGNLHTKLPKLPNITPLETREMSQAFNTMVSDISDKNKEIQDKTLTLQVTMDNMAEGIALIDQDHQIRLHNKQLSRFLGLHSDIELTNKRITDIMSDQSGNHSLLNSLGSDSDKKTGLKNQLFSTEIRITNGNFLEFRVSTLPDGCRVVTCVDISERKSTEARIQHLATHDTLTGLPNRHAFDEELGNLIRQASYNDDVIPLLYMDLDQFKEINDSLGHELGDRLLQAVANRIAKLTKNKHIIARLGGDEFAILLKTPADLNEVRQAASSITEGLMRRFVVEGHEIFIRTSMGITLYPKDGTTPGELLKRADLAMYTAKARRAGDYCFYERLMATDLDQRRSKETSLRKSLEANEFILYYQPICDAISRKITSFEALLRWQGPDGSITLPDQFISVAEDSGLIVPIGDWVIEEACRQIAEWRTMGLHPPPVAINLSGVQFRHQNLAEKILNCLKKHNLPTEVLAIEITESTALSNKEQVLKVVQQLANHGIELSMDDFGTGYSSLSHLRYFPVRKVKIDKSFVSNIGINEDDTSIVSAIIELSHSLRLPTIAEGVETMEQLVFLTKSGCDQVQGHFLYRADNPTANQALLSTLDEISNILTNNTRDSV